MPDPQRCPDRGDAGSGACYLHATRADLAAAGAKLSGSAQVWSSDAVLQHGSIVVSRNAEREAEVFGLGPGAAAQLASTTATLSSLHETSPSAETIRESVCASLGTAWGVTLARGS